jgi:hypothetical protein
MRTPELLELLTKSGVVVTLEKLAGGNTTALPRTVLEDIFAEQGASSPNEAVEARDLRVGASGHD